jgi:hypothetical protein
MNRASIFSAITVSAIAALGLALSPSSSVAQQELPLAPSPNMQAPAPELPPGLSSFSSNKLSAAAAVSFPSANTVDWWRNRKFTYHYETIRIDEYITSAQLTTNNNLDFVLYLYSAEVATGTSCQRSVLNYFYGKLQQFYTGQQPWLYLPGKGVQTWTDTCNPALDHKVPLSGNYAWNYRSLDKNGSRFEFWNPHYNGLGFISDFIFTRIQ